MGIALRPFFALSTAVGLLAVASAQPSLKVIDAELTFPENTRADLRNAKATGLSADGTRLSANRVVYYENPLRIDREAALISYANGSWSMTMLGGYPQKPDSVDHSSTTIGISGDGLRPYGPAGHVEYNVNWPTLYSPVTALLRPADNSYITITGLNHSGTIAVGYGDGSYHEDPYHEPRQYWWHRWTPSGVEYISPPSGSNTGVGQPSAISADGSVFTGYSGFPGIPNWSAVRWTKATGVQPLPKPDYIKHAYGYGISANGQVIVGTASYFDETFNNARPCYWTPSKGFVLFDAPAPSDARGELHEANQDGTVMGGIAYGVDFGGAMIYTPWSGPHLLLPYLEQSGVVVGDVRLSTVVGISADGKTIAGNCTIPGNSGFRIERPYVAKIELPNGPTNLSLTRTSTTGGNAFNGTVTLHHAATEPFTVNLESSDPALVQVPASIEIGANATSASFSVATQGVAENTLVSIHARYNGVVLTRNVTLVPAVLANAAVNPTEVFGTSRATGVVKLTGKVVADTTIALSDNTSAITIPASVIVPAGATGVNFPITTGNVSTEVTRQIFATLNGVTKSTNLKIKPYHAVQSLTLTPSTIAGGNNGSAKVQLTLPAPPGGAVVNLSTNSSAIQVPVSINIPAGQSSGIFGFTTSAVSATVTRNVIATYGQLGKTAVLTLNPAGLLSLAANPSSVKGGTSTTVTLTMDAPVSGAKRISVTDDSSVLTTPASVTVASGSRVATFTVGTTAVATTVTRKVSATYNGVTRSVFITVTP